MDLFESRLSQSSVDQPLAESLRPQNFDHLIGQNRIFSDNKILINKLQNGKLQSLILWGPPGCGKTSFAKVLINEVKAHVFEENAIDLGAKRIREIGVASKRRLIENNEKTLLFVDEIHRLNRGQQDVLLPFVEKGYFYLVGATTENPSYQLNAALTSRCRLIVFESLNSQDIEKLALRALEQKDISRKAILSDEAFDWLIETSHGDGRKLLNLMEDIIFSFENKALDTWPIGLDGLMKLYESSGLRFDKKGDEHYDTVSVFIKCIRGSDPDAGIYYLARMLEGGEDPVFIARRLVVLASEDIGNADPQALNVAVNCLQAVELVGMPEARINLAQAVTYLASSPKSNRSYQAINKAIEVVKKTGPLPVPKAFRSSKTKLMKDLGYGVDYKYTQDGATGWLPQEYFPAELKERKFYEPVDRGFEKRIKEYLKWIKGLKE